MLISYSENDINKKLAHQAHYATSFVPEERAKYYVTSYMQEMAAMVEEFSRFVTDENEADIMESLEYYRQGYLKRLHDYLSAHSRVMSPMITGPARFPVARNNKRIDTADKRRDEWLEWCNRTKERMRRMYDPRIIARAPISSDDSNAIEKLQAKIEAAEEYQEFMKAANAVIRKKKLSDDQKVEQLAELGISELSARKLLTTSDFTGRAGFAAYQLTNNNANIRRMKERVEALRKEQEKAGAEDKEVDGVIIRENTDIGRLQLIFEGKPPEQTRAALKARGFRWSPREGAWQRLLNDNARRDAEAVFEAISE